MSCRLDVLADLDSGHEPSSRIRLSLNTHHTQRVHRSVPLPEHCGAVLLDTVNIRVYDHLWARLPRHAHVHRLCGGIGARRAGCRHPGAAGHSAIGELGFSRRRGGAARVDRWVLGDAGARADACR